MENLINENKAKVEISKESNKGLIDFKNFIHSCAKDLEKESNDKRKEGEDVESIFCAGMSCALSSVEEMLDTIIKQTKTNNTEG